MLEKLFEQFVPSVPSAKNQGVQPEPAYIKPVPRVPSVPPEKSETETIDDVGSGIEAAVYIYPRFVICYTPNGKGLQVLAKDTETEAFLLRANPPQCGNCQNFTPHHAHGKGTGTCTAGIKPSGVCHWSETQHTCDGFKSKEQTLC